MGKTPFCYDPANTFSDKSQRALQLVIDQQATEKGWSKDKSWLMLSAAKEFFELWALYEHKGKCEVWITEIQRKLLIERLPVLIYNERDPENYRALTDFLETLKAKTADFDTQVAKEAGDIDYFRQQLLLGIAPNVDPDAAVKCVYDNNAVTLKKTFINGEIVHR